MADAEARKKQLEDMKKKLADMKKSREQGAAASEAVAGVTVPVAIGSPPVAPPVRIGNDSVTQAKGIEDLDDYLAGVLGEKPGFEPSKPPSSASTPHPVAVQPPRLTLSQLTLATNIGSMICLPKQVEMYNKETMTDDMTGMSSPHAHHRHRSTGSETGFDSIAKRKAELFPETPFASVSPDKGQLGEDDDDSGAVTPAAAEAVLLSPEFQAFLDRSSSILERALALSDSKWVYDVTVDYSAVTGEAWQPAGTKQNVLSPLNTFSCRESLTHLRAVTALDWSPNRKELVAVAYSAPEGASQSAGLAASEGLVLVWSVLVPTRPERVFTCPSPVESVAFHPHHPHLVIGGTYSGLSHRTTRALHGYSVVVVASGQLYVWDMRHKGLPVQRSKLSTRSHTYPVYCLNMVGTASAASLVTVSTDGLLCNWDASNVTEPLSNLKLAWEKRDIAPMCVSFPASSDTTTFVAGCEDGGLYECHMHGRTPGPAAVIAAHNGPVTSVQHNPWLPLLLSSGMDWTVKLWYTSQHARTIQATKPVDGAESAPTGSQQQQSPLVVLESTSAALFDAQWCPAHVSVFAVGDGVGNIDVWNLLTDADNPLFKLQVCDCAVNKLRWSTDGRHLAVGDSAGNLTVVKVAAEVVAMRAEDKDEFARKVSALTTSAGATPAFQ